MAEPTSVSIDGLLSAVELFQVSYNDDWFLSDPGPAIVSTVAIFGPVGILLALGVEPEDPLQCGRRRHT